MYLAVTVLTIEIIFIYFALQLNEVQILRPEKVGIRCELIESYPVLIFCLQSLCLSIPLPTFSFGFHTPIKTSLSTQTTKRKKENKDDMIVRMRHSYTSATGGRLIVFFLLFAYYTKCSKIRSHPSQTYWYLTDDLQ